MCPDFHVCSHEFKKARIKEVWIYVDYYALYMQTEHQVERSRHRDTPRISVNDPHNILEVFV